MTSIVVRGVVTAVAVFALQFASVAGEPGDSARKTSPEDALQTFRTLPGFHVEIVAAEPLIRDPVSVAVDAQGRMYVVEYPEYNLAAETETGGQAGAVKLLEDIDGDGRYDKSSEFLDEVDHPSAVACYDGGVFVGVAPNILYCKDTNGDGVADVRKVVFTGFAHDVRKSGEARLNSIRWGLDNRFHVCTNYSGGFVQRAGDDAGKRLSVRNRGFVFDPRTRKYEASSGGGQHGQAVNDWGVTVLSKNSDPFRLLIYDDRYLRFNPLLKAPPPVVSISPQGDEAKLWRISKEEDWRVERTRLRVQGLARGGIEGGGSSTGYFTSATGATFYRGHAWPEQFRGSLFVGEVAHNIVHRARLEPSGVGFRARRADRGREFLASTDNRFRPVQFTNAPDGTLYVVDMHRALIESVQFLPPALLEKVDVFGGSKQGRIYRIVPDGFRQPPRPRLDKATTSELVALLEHPGGWHRDTAARLLYERQDAAAVDPLRRLASKSKHALARIHAMYALNGLGEFHEQTVLTALQDPHPRGREHALRLAEKWAGRSDKVFQAMRSLADDPDRRVRFQLLFSLGACTEEDDRASVAKTIAEALFRDGEDRWIQLAALTAAATSRGELLGRVLANQKYRHSAHGGAMLLSLCEQIGMAGQSDEISRSIRSIERLSDDEQLAKALTLRLASNLTPATRSQLDANIRGVLAKRVADALQESRITALRADADHARRIEAIGTLRLSKFAVERGTFLRLLDLREPQPVQSAALETLAAFEEREVASMILSAWAQFSPMLRSRATETLLTRPVWIRLFLGAIEHGNVRRGDVDPARMKLLMSHPDQRIRQRAAKLSDSTALGARKDIVAQYQQSLKIRGDMERGRMMFKKVCSACHRLENVGIAIGADLKAIRQRGSEAIVLNVLDPNREVKPQYLSYVLITDDGRSLTGMIRAESANSITMRQPDGKETTVLRANIEAMRSTGLSFMPEGLERQMDVKAMADLLAYLESLR